MNDKDDPPNDARGARRAGRERECTSTRRSSFFRAVAGGESGRGAIVHQPAVGDQRRGESSAAPAVGLRAAVSLDPRLYAFIGVAAILTILPGADMALVTRNVLALGRRRTMLTIVGHRVRLRDSRDRVGARPVGRFSRRRRRHSTVVKTVGAAYLVWIGVQSIRDAGRRRRAAERARAIARDRPVPSGFSHEHSEPEGRDLLSDVPAAVHRAGRAGASAKPVSGQHSHRDGRRLAHARTRGSSIGLGAVLTRPSVKAWLERVTGGLLIALGARLAWERR